MHKSKSAKFLALLLCAVMIIGLLPCQAFADAGQTGEPGLEKGSRIDGTEFSVTSLRNYAIAPDISERVIITNNDAGNSQTVANVMEVNTAGGRAKQMVSPFRCFIHLFPFSPKAAAENTTAHPMPRWPACRKQ